jgi:hypothetical protein
MKHEITRTDTKKSGAGSKSALSLSPLLRAGFCKRQIPNPKSKIQNQHVRASAAIGRRTQSLSLPVLTGVRLPQAVSLFDDSMRGRSGVMGIFLK